MNEREWLLSYRPIGCVSISSTTCSYLGEAPALLYPILALLVPNHVYVHDIHVPNRVRFYKHILFT